MPSSRSDASLPDEGGTGHDEQAEVVHLRRGGTSVVARTTSSDLPCVLHWGPDLGDLTAGQLRQMELALRMPGPDAPTWPHAWAALLPRQTGGWLGRPGVRGGRNGTAWALTYAEVRHELTTQAGQDLLRSTAVDPGAGVEVTTELEVGAAGLVRLRALIRNQHHEPYTVTHLEPALPVPAEATELMDLAGSPTHERVPQRRAFDQGQWVRESWGGRPGHDSPGVLCAGRPGFGFRSGRVWGVHLAWSGNQVLSAERSYTGWSLLRGGEILEDHEIVLAQGDTYSSPWLCASWGEGLDELSGRFHDFLRARPTHPGTPRPVTLNTWEATYFDLDPDGLVDLAERAAGLGVERFVIDDGWFLGRRDDTRGLGDWYVDPAVFPDGLAPVAKTVHELGMQLGLWFEPEMVNLDSDLARAHPDWVMATHAGPGIASRHQHVLDLTNPAAWQHVLERISSIVGEHGVAAIKWDHNRPVAALGRGPHHTPAVHAQTRAVYAMMRALQERHPGLEIESCCGGGGRLDLGIMEHASRVWPSDVVDPHERHRIVRWTGLTLPLELIGTHVGSRADHNTGRRHSLAFRAGTALWGHMGVEWDLRILSEDESDELRQRVRLYKRHRALLHSGRVVRGEAPNPALQLDGVVSEDGREGLFRLSALDHSAQFPPGRVPLPGLSPDTDYTVDLVGPTDIDPASLPPWALEPTELDGRVLGELGLMAPLLKPDELILVHVVASSSDVHL